MIRFTGGALFIFMLFTLSISGAVAKDNNAELKKEIQALKQGQEQIQKDIKEIKKLLQQGARAAPDRQAFKPTDITLGDKFAQLGEDTAPVTLVEFSDYQCPYCKRHATTVMPKLAEDYIDTGKLRFVMREYPIPNLHPRAEVAAVAVLCAGDQDNYWGMHDALFNDQKANTDDDFKAMANSLGLDSEAFDACLSSKKFNAQIKADQAEGQKLGVSGTPSFVMGLTDPNDPNKVHLTRFIRGAQPYAIFAAAIDELLEGAREAE
ncbi:MAG: DsbA family protein [Lysobacterales bacterium]